MLNKTTTRAAIFFAVMIATLPAALPAARDQGAQPAARPKLVVLLVVDQLRTDYLMEYGATFNAGLRRLTHEGAWFKEAAYPYLNTVTCAGHSTIGTGTFPYQHGMVLNSWFDRRTGKTTYCTDDPSAGHISYNGLPPGNGDSARKLLRPSRSEQIHKRGGR